MSDRMCNYCLYNKLVKHANNYGMIVTTRESDFSEIREFNRGSSGVDVLLDGKFYCWFMELPAKCEC